MYDLTHPRRPTSDGNTSLIAFHWSRAVPGSLRACDPEQGTRGVPVGGTSRGGSGSAVIHAA